MIWGRALLDPELTDDEVVASGRILRQFAGIWLVLFAALAGWALYRGHDGRAIGFTVAALVVGPLGLARPMAIRPLFSTLMTITRPIGLVVNRVILAIMFYGLFTPLALIFRLAGRDALGLKRPDGKPSYWKRRPAVTDPRRYFRQ